MGAKKAQRALHLGGIGASGAQNPGKARISQVNDVFVTRKGTTTRVGARRDAMGIIDPCLRPAFPLPTT